MITQLSRVLQTSSEDFQKIKRIYNTLNVIEDPSVTVILSDVSNYKHEMTLGVPKEQILLRAQSHIEICTFSDSEDSTFQTICNRINTSTVPDPEYLECLRSLAQADCENYVPRKVFPPPFVVEPKWILEHESYSTWVNNPKT
ncbi:hypothetical protein DSL72_000513 [Monilinia vaccinii-corymbosi]|uniref:Uncharacterized protein n=1 Tax=Monilinia vaccinii-corymbosi TaxID=61207 RepID=A0A8A3P4F2_9HELO|nr:hypothetical protein DSL72_000513 [Monilinia vaccinii-corymbosi]